jgi:hypothetical protein
MLAGVALTVVLTAGMGSTLAGCSFEGTVKDLTGGNVDLGGPHLPADFPKAVPLHAGAVVFGARVGSGDGTVWNVTVKVPGASAYKDIQKQLADAGFTGEFGATAPDGGGTGTFSGGRYSVLVVVTGAGDNGWVANYSVSKHPVPTATPGEVPTATPGEVPTATPSASP